MIHEYNAHRTAYAELSEDRSMRYVLRRSLTGKALDVEQGHPPVVFVMLNPSTADALKDDATIRRCINFGQRWGRRWMSVVNLFARRATDPRDLIAAARRGDDQIADEALMRECCDDRALVVCGWGVHGALADRNETVLHLLQRADVKLYMLGLTKAGHPRHPLYMPARSQPRRWSP